MSLYLHTSSRTEELVTFLAAQTARQRARDPWATLPVVVPNPQVGHHVREGLARILGVAARIDLRYLDGLLRPQTDLLRRTALQGALLTLFQDEALPSDPALAPVTRYLGSDTVGSRAVQLSGELARLWEDLALSRPDWILAWAEGHPHPGETPDTAWQRLLWSRARHLLRPEGPPLRTLPELLADPEGLAGLDLPPVLHVFGLSHVAQAYHRLFARLAERVDLCVYALNPCEAFWEDLRTGRLPRPDEAEDCLPLRLWGRPGRDHLRDLGALSSLEPLGSFPSVPGDALLPRIQEAIRTRTAQPEPLSQADGSLRLLACPGPRREAEAVADALWDLLAAREAEGRPLRTSDIAIVVPASEQEAYLAHLQAAFAGAHGLPLAAGDQPGGATAALLEAADRLLRLPASPLGLPDVLDLLGHPAFQAGHPDLDPEPWRGWCEAAGIRLGADAADLEGTYLDRAHLGRDRLSWDQGLHRLSLGIFLPPEGAVDLPGGPFEALPAPDVPGRAAFLAILRPLLADARRLRGLHQGPAAWGRDLARFLQAHLREGEDEGRGRDLARMAEALLALRDLEAPGLPAPRLDLAAALELAGPALDRVAKDSLPPFPRGVVVSSYLPMRALPRPVIVLMGLGEGLFPARDLKSPLDLRETAESGDVSPSERDRYLFLEMLLGARDRLILTYPCRDPLTQEVREPSPVLQELVSVAAQHLSPEALEAWPETLPAHRWETVGTHAAEAPREALARAWGAHHRDGRSLPPEVQEILAPLLPPIPPPTATPPGHLIVTLDDLVAWMRCPLQGAARMRLGLHRPWDEDPPAADEALATPAFLARRLREGALLESLREGKAPDAAFDAHRARLEAQGLVPLGVLADRDLHVQRTELGEWHSRFQERPTPEMWGFGAPKEDEAPWDRRLSPPTLEVDLGGRRVAVSFTGRLPWRIGESWTFCLEKTPEATASDWGPKVVAARLLCALAGVDAGSKAAFVRLAKKPDPDLALPSLEAAEAQAQLGAWLREVLGGDLPPAVPLQAVLKGAEDLQEWLEDQDGLPADLRGPIPDPARFLPDPDSPWREAAQARLAPLLALMSKEPA